jgi:hypothetical protein
MPAPCYNAFQGNKTTGALQNRHPIHSRNVHIFPHDSQSRSNDHAALAGLVEGSDMIDMDSSILLYL